MGDVVDIMSSKVVTQLSKEALCLLRIYVCTQSS